MNMKLFFGRCHGGDAFIQCGAECRGSPLCYQREGYRGPGRDGSLYHRWTNPPDTISAAIVKGGVFVLAGHVSEPNIYFVNFVAAKKKVPLFIGNDKMSMSGAIENMNGIKVTGSSSNDDFMEFQSTFNTYFERLNVIGRMLQSHAPEGGVCRIR